MAKYCVRISCEVLNKWRTPDEVFELSDEQALFLKRPYGNVIVPYTPVTVQDSALEPKKDRSDGKLNRS